MVKLNKKAFTLVELLAVIVILSTLILIVMSKMTSLTNQKTDDVDDVTFNLLTKAAKIYLDDNSFNYPIRQGSTYCVSLKTLTDNDYLEAPIKSFKTSTDITNQKTIKVKYDNGYSYSLVDNGACEEIIPICKAVEDATTPNKPPYEEYTPGDAYDCEVKAGNWYRFYILSVEGNNVNLIAQQNITSTGEFTSESQDNDEWYKTELVESEDLEHKYGPQTAYNYLKEATKNWNNIPLIKSFTHYDEGNQSNSEYGYQSIITGFDSTTGDYITTIIPYSSDYGNPITYKNMRARLPYYNEIIENTSCKIYSTSDDNGTCPLWMVNYLFESEYYAMSEKINSEGANSGYWTLSSYGRINELVLLISNEGNVSYNQMYLPNFGVRPVITLSKTNLLNIVE